VLRILQANGLVINAAKCIFGATEVEFLGHHVSASGISPLADRVAAIRRFPQPVTVRDLQAFLGLVNFYRRFIKAAARILLPLTAALAGGPAGSAKLHWTPEMTTAFNRAKEAVAAACKLGHPSSGAEISLVTDASASHIGAVLQQRAPASTAWQPLAFFLAKLTTAQQKYSAFDRELLAVYVSIRHFRFMLEGRPFTVFTDHQLLLGSLGRISDTWLARQRRQLSFIAEFAATLRHISGSSNVVADTLSRPPQAVNAVTTALSPPAATPLVDIRDLAAAQSSCADCQRALTSPHLSATTAVLDNIQVVVDTSSGVIRPVVPAAFGRRIFEAVHNLVHAGIRATRRLISSRYVWPGLAEDVQAWCRSCQCCAAAKVTMQPKAAVQPIAVPLMRFSHLHLDLVGPLPASREGFCHLLTIVDRSTWWCKAVPLKSTAAEDCAAALVVGWIARFGVPAAITSDRGPQFTSAVWAAFTAKLGVQHHMTTAYHPQSNGLVERLHRRLKEALKARLAGASLPDHLPWVLLLLQSSPREDSGISSAEMVYGAPLALPGGLVVAQEQPPEYFTQLFLSRNGGAGCVHVVRLECGTPNELADLFADLVGGCSIPAGTVVLISSWTHLADVGLGAYCEDICRVIAKMGRIFHGGLVVLPGLTFPPGPVGDPYLLKNLADQQMWSKHVAKIVEGGGGRSWGSVSTSSYSCTVIRVPVLSRPSVAHGTGSRSR
jgi:RNase H-like domain found in reverse transcriptase/Integrase zinc binding domain/Integrase core domain